MNDLTGNYRIRTSFFGKCIIQVEYKFEASRNGFVYSSRGWRDARIEDLQTINYFNK